MSAPAFRFVGVEAVPCLPGDEACPYLRPDGLYPMEFEGRPEDVTPLQRGEVHDFELNYKFDASNPAAHNYAADLVYAPSIHEEGRTFACGS